MLSGDYKNIYVIGDIHGAARALEQCLERVKFDWKDDLLISLGDVCDGWPETNRCMDIFTSLENYVFVRGNHDWWTQKWINTKIPDPEWLKHGGKATIESFGDNIDEKYIRFLKEGKKYFELDNILFVHAGIHPSQKIEEQNEEVLYWDRLLFQIAMLNLHITKEEVIVPQYDEVYIGHNPIHREGYLHPLQSGNVWMMDTGAGWDGVLTIMNIRDKTYKTSDPVPSLYPGIEGRGGIIYK